MLVDHSRWATLNWVPLLHEQSSTRRLSAEENAETPPLGNDVVTSNHPLSSARKITRVEDGTSRFRILLNFCTKGHTFQTALKKGQDTLISPN